MHLRDRDATCLDCFDRLAHAYHRFRDVDAVENLLRVGHGRLARAIPVPGAQTVALRGRSLGRMHDVRLTRPEHGRQWANGPMGQPRKNACI